MAYFSAMETEDFLIVFSFFRSEFPNTDNVDVHYIRVLGFWGIRSKGLIGVLSGALVPFGNLFSLFPLSLQVNVFKVPFMDCDWYHVHQRDLLHERRGNSC